MHRLRPAPFAPLLELYLALHKLFIFAGPIVNAFAFGAGKFDESLLGHARHYTK